MLFKDIDIFVAAARAILMGQDPYHLPGVEVFYPLPFYFLFVPLAFIPLPLVHVLWTALQAVVLVALLRRRTMFVMLSTPVVLCFILGQVDIVMTGLFSALRRGIGGGLALAFLVLKPQLVLLLAPWMVWRWFRGERRQLYIFVALLSLILISSFAIQPEWINSFMQRSGARVRAGVSSSIWGLLSFLPVPLWLGSAVVLVAIIVIWAWRQKNIDITVASGLLVSPFIFSYNLMPLTLLVSRPLFWVSLTVLSWLAFGLSALVSGDGPEALLTLVVLGALYFETRKRVQRAPLQLKIRENGLGSEGVGGG